jgi:hypothetical protein
VPIRISAEGICIKAKNLMYGIFMGWILQHRSHSHIVLNGWRTRHDTRRSSLRHS